MHLHVQGINLVGDLPEYRCRHIRSVLFKTLRAVNDHDATVFGAFGGEIAHKRRVVVARVEAVLEFLGGAGFARDPVIAAAHILGRAAFHHAFQHPPHFFQGFVRADFLVEHPRLVGFHDLLGHADLPDHNRLDHFPIVGHGIVEGQHLDRGDFVFVTHRHPRQ